MHLNRNISLYLNIFFYYVIHIKKDTYLILFIFIFNNINKSLIFEDKKIIVKQ